MRWPLIWRRNGVDRARYEQVIDQRDEARTEAANHVCKIVELCGEIDALRMRPTEAQLRAELHRGRKAYAALEELLLDVQKSNEVQARELREHAEQAREVTS